MIIKSLQIKNYRNYEDEFIEFDKGINVLYGDNAQGKTNILEAIYLSSTAKSHKGSKDREIIKFDKDESHIKTYINKNEIDYKIDIHLKKNKTKGIAIDAIPIRKASDLFGIANVVFFSPEDLNIIKSSPSERRKFIDFELCQLDKIYLHCLLEYNKILAQRNKLLKELYIHSEWKDTLDIWDIKLIEYGTKIINIREEFIKELNNIIKNIHLSLSGNVEEIEIIYDKNVEIKDYEDKIKSFRDTDIKLKSTYIGPHKDDISFIIKRKNKKEIDARKYASQGQQRTVALSLKLSEIELVKKRVNNYPILLLDDVLSELDFKRQDKLLNYINNIQTIITCTGIKDLLDKNISINKIFEVNNGKVYEKSR